MLVLQLVVAIGLMCLAVCSATIMTPPRVVASAKTSSSSANTKDNFKNIKTSVVKNVKRIVTGFGGIVPNFREYQRLSTKRKKFGDESLSYSEFEKCQQGKEDFNKGIRLGFTIPLAPEFCFYSYFVFPAMSFSNPWAWQNLPSSFDRDPEDLRVRETIMYERRYAGLLSAMAAVQKEMIEDTDLKSRDVRLDRFEMLRDTLKQSANIEKAFSSVLPWLTSQRRTAGKLQLNLAAVPGSAIKDAIKALGMEGVPNIPIIRRVNVGDLGKYLEKIKETDAFLVKKGLAALSGDELERACFARCIYTQGRSDSVLRGELRQWLRLAESATLTYTPRGDYALSYSGSDASTGSSNSRGSARRKGGRPSPQEEVLNPYNRRLALMALNVAKSSRNSGLLDGFLAL